MKDERIAAEIGHWAGVYEIPLNIVEAVVMVESGGNPFAVRFEPHYRYLFDPDRVRPAGCSLETETSLQKTSFGLMQVMGAVIREQGFKGWLTEIVSDVDLQLQHGCRHLARHIKRWGLPGGIAAYNAGSVRRDDAGYFINAEYVSKVLGIAYRLSKERTAEV